MTDGPEDNVNDPFDDELDAAMMDAADLVARAKAVGLHKLELPISDQSTQWIVTVKKVDMGEHQEPSSDGNGARLGQRYGKMP